MIPLNVTHTAIVTKQVHSQLLSPDNSSESYSDVLPEPSSELRRTLSTLISFFAGAYKTVFGFDQGPPLHDALTIAYVCHPLLFSCQRYRVDVEIHGVLTSGETVVDKRYCSSDDSWGPNGKNCLVAESVNVIISLISTTGFFSAHISTNRSLISSASF
jgi:uridine nucleosidase